MEAVATPARRAAPDTVLLLVAAALVCRLAVATALPLLPDEAYYATWPLAWGHFDHPPAIGWLIAATSSLGGPLGVRLGAVLCGAIAATAAASISRSPVHTTLAWLATPLLLAVTTVATPDAPLLAAWMLALAAASRDRWALCGLAGGLAALAKLTGWLVVPLLVVASDHPKRWRAVPVAAAVAAPNVLWNATHGWPTVEFQLHHGFASDPASPVLWLAGQALVAAPLLVALSVTPTTRAEHLARATALPTLALFAAAALLSRGEANWTAPAWASATVLLAGSPHARRALALGAPLTAALAAVALSRLPPDPTAWATSTVDGPIYAERYQEAGLLARAGLPVLRPAGCGRPDDHPRVDAVDGWLLRPTRSGDTVCGGLIAVGPVYTNGPYQLVRVRR